MIPRYTGAEMGRIWSDQRKYETWLQVEIAAVEAMGRAGIVPPEAARDIRQRARIDISRIEEIEQVTQHDVIAFTTAVAEQVGPAAKWLHFGLTASDVIELEDLPRGAVAGIERAIDVRQTLDLRRGRAEQIDHLTRIGIDLVDHVVQETVDEQAAALAGAGGSAPRLHRHDHGTDHLVRGRIDKEDLRRERIDREDIAAVRACGKLLEQREQRNARAEFWQR